MAKLKAKKKAVKKEFIQSDDLNEMASTVIREQSLELQPARISYLLVYPNISKTCVSKPIKTGRELRHYSNVEYLIEISGEVWDALDEKLRYALVHHQLKHIMPVMDDKTGDWKFEIRKHDVEDFRSVTKQHGTDWSSNVKTIVSSLYDLSPKAEDSISI